MNANYEEIYRVGNLEADFQQVTLVQFFLKFYNIVVKHQFNLSREKLKIFSLTKISKNHLIIEIA